MNPDNNAGAPSRLPPRPPDQPLPNPQQNELLVPQEQPPRKGSPLEGLASLVNCQAQPAPSLSPPIPTSRAIPFPIPYPVPKIVIEQPPDVQPLPEGPRPLSPTVQMIGGPPGTDIMGQLTVHSPAELVRKYYHTPFHGKALNQYYMYVPYPREKGTREKYLENPFEPLKQFSPPRDNYMDEFAATERDWVAMKGELLRRRQRAAAASGHTSAPPGQLAPILTCPQRVPSPLITSLRQRTLSGEYASPPNPSSATDQRPGFASPPNPSPSPSTTADSPLFRATLRASASPLNPPTSPTIPAKSPELRSALVGIPSPNRTHSSPPMPSSTTGTLRSFRIQRSPMTSPDPPPVFMSQPQPQPGPFPINLEKNGVTLCNMGMELVEEIIEKARKLSRHLVHLPYNNGTWQFDIKASRWKRNLKQQIVDFRLKFKNIKILWNTIDNAAKHAGGQYTDIESLIPMKEDKSGKDNENLSDELKELIAERDELIRQLQERNSIIKKFISLEREIVYEMNMRLCAPEIQNPCSMCDDILNGKTTQ